MEVTQYRTLFADLPVAWAVHDRGRILDANHAAAELFAISSIEDVLGGNLLDHVHPDSVDSVRSRLQQLYASGDPVQAVPERMLRGDGRDLWVETIASLTSIDGRPVVQVLCWDVTDRVLEAERLNHAAHHDGLTGLANRALLESRWRVLVDDWVTSGATPHLLFCDLDGFKRVNDTLGHEAGDRVLKAVAARLAHAIRPTDILGRFGGDEFVVLLGGEDVPAVEHLARRLTDVLLEPIHVADGVVRLGMSVGRATPQSPDESLDSLLRRADRAMYEAKRSRSSLSPTVTADLSDS